MDQTATVANEFKSTQTAFIAVWLGLLCGLVDGLGLFCFTQTGWVNPKPLLWVSGEIVWFSAFSNLLIFAFLGSGLALGQRMFPRLRSPAIAMALFGFLTIYDWVRLVTPGRIQFYGALILSLGLAAGLNRGLSKHQRAVNAFCRRTFRWMAGIAISLFVGIEVGPVVVERVVQFTLSAARPGTPNILVIVVDTLRADHLSSYGYPQQTTPHLDSIAKQGVVFENASSTAPWTLPSHASLLTGRYPHEHKSGYPKRSPDRRYPVISDYLQTRGYRTGAFSANTTYFARAVGLGRGFIHFEDQIISMRELWLRTTFGRDFYTFADWAGHSNEFPGLKTAEETTQSALRWIDRDHSHPFFVIVNFIDVHDRYSPEQAETSIVPQAQALRRDDDKNVDSYDSAIAYVDDQVYQLFMGLRQSGQSENTIVVITSDHGESFGEHGLFRHGNSLYWEAIHVPLVFWWPKHIPAGVRIDQMVTNAALPATLIELLGDNADKPFPGPSLAALWLTPGGERDWPHPLAELYGYGKSLLSGEWHFVEHDNSDAELYKPRTDPHELQDRSTTAEGKRIVVDLGEDLKTLLAK